MTAYFERMRRLVFASVVICLVQQVHAEEVGTKRALLIGVGQYQALPSLGGSRNDVELIGEILVQRYGFSSDNITTLLDENATRAGILSAMRALVADAGKQDTIVLHYSGHGSQVEDLDGDEADGFDETLCPYDARTPGVADITDDELQRILGGIDVGSAVVILDSCHSGTALRAAPAEILSRSIPPDLRTNLYRDANFATRGVVPLPGAEPYVLFSAAAANQQELDGPFGQDGERLGLLTAALSRTLATHSGRITPRELLEGIERNVEKIKPMFAGYPIPEAQLEGPIALIDAPLFTPDSTSSTRPPSTQALSSAATTTTRVYLKADDPALRQAIRSRLTEGIEWAPSIDTADAVIQCSAPGHCEVFGLQGTVRVASVSQPSGDATARSVARVAGGAAAIAELLSIDNPGGMQLELSVTGKPAANSTPLGTRGITLTASVSTPRIRFYEPGVSRDEYNSLQLQVQTGKACYLTLVSVDAVGKVQQLLPNPIQEEANFMPAGYLQAGQNYLIPDSFSDDNRAGFHLDYAPPAGTDTVRAFCTADRRVAEALRNDIAAIAAGDYRAPISGTLISTRGLTNVRPDTGTLDRDWGAATVTVDIGGY